ncbi:MAG: hypothetical protein V3R29_04405 [Candidatus Acidoferrales bacterium]
MFRSWRWLPLVLVAFLAGGYVLVTLQRRIDRQFERFRVQEQFLYISQPEWVKRLALGYDGLLGCIYWTRAVQHYGWQRLTYQKYNLLYPLLDITTTLDPQLLIAYRFGAIFLTEEPPRGPGQYPQAVELLRKGIGHNPSYWRLWYDLGFVYYRKQQYQQSAAAFYEGSKLPGARDWMKVMAAKIAAEGGQRRFAIELWTVLYETTDSPAIRQNARAHLEGLLADEQIEQLQRLVDHYEEQTGRALESWRELLEKGFLRALPRDSQGYPYVLDPQGRVRLHPESPIEHSELGRAE